MNSKMRKGIILLCIIMFATGVCWRFRPRSISDYLPHEQPAFLNLYALEIPGTSFTEVKVSTIKNIYDEITKMKIQPLIFESNLDGYARYYIRAQFDDPSAIIKYEIEYYPGVDTIQIFYNTKCVVTGKLPETEKIQHLLPSFPNSEKNYRRSS